ncbi:MAG: hydantoinase/carbamoylase family amidase, partial [SAR324 cluster bacterium]|nr:hydantoinase/carbamoylase family amidase [SAR324 cluster bacterium]
ENENIQIGVVSGAQGQIAMNVEILGEAGHSGTVPMKLRKDALVCAIDVINACRDLVVEEGKGVFTVGAFKLEPNSRTTIPDKISFGIDLRHPNAASLQNLQNLMNKKIKVKAAEHCCQERIEVLFHKEPVVFTNSCVESVQSASDQLKYSSLVMPSGAFHDACLMASQVPTGMIFVPSQKGVSHNPTEYTSQEQLEKGANVLLHALLNLGEKGVPLS